MSGEFHGDGTIENTISMAQSMSSDQAKAVEAVLAERRRQDAKWGVQTHTPGVWLGILGEEFGEVSKDVNCIAFGPAEKRAEYAGRWEAEMVQVAAVAVAALEDLYRQRRKRRREIGREVIAENAGLLRRLAPVDGISRDYRDLAMLGSGGLLPRSVFDDLLGEPPEDTPDDTEPMLPDTADKTIYENVLLRGWSCLPAPAAVVRAVTERDLAEFLAAEDEAHPGLVSPSPAEIVRDVREVVQYVIDSPGLPVLWNDMDYHSIEKVPPRLGYDEPDGSPRD